MKYITSIIKLFSLALLLIVGYACTDNFDKINRKDYQVDKEELGRESYNVGASLKGLQGLVIPTEEHLYQFVEALGAGAFAGYIGCTVEWTAKFETYNPPIDWQEAPFSDLVTRTYPFYRHSCRIRFDRCKKYIDIWQRFRMKQLTKQQWRG